MATSTSTSERQNHMWEIARKMDFCMFVTMDSRKPWARPMSTIVRHEEGKDLHADGQEVREGRPDQVKFLLRGARLRKQADIPHRAGQGAAADGSRNRAQSVEPGRAGLLAQRSGDKNIVAIEVTPEQAEYWEGDNALVSSASFAWAIVTRKVAEPGESTKLRLAPSRGKRVSRTSSTRAKTAAKKPAKAKRR